MSFTRLEIEIKILIINFFCLQKESKQISSNIHDVFVLNNFLYQLTRFSLQTKDCLSNENLYEKSQKISFQFLAFSRSFQITQYIPRVTNALLPGSCKLFVDIKQNKQYLNDLYRDNFQIFPPTLFTSIANMTNVAKVNKFGMKTKILGLGPYIYKQGRQCRLAQLQTTACTQRPLRWRRCLLLPFYKVILPSGKLPHVSNCFCFTLKQICGCEGRSLRIELLCILLSKS